MEICIPLAWETSCVVGLQDVYSHMRMQAHIHESYLEKIS